MDMGERMAVHRFGTYCTPLAPSFSVACVLLLPCLDPPVAFVSETTTLLLLAEASIESMRQHEDAFDSA